MAAATTLFPVDAPNAAREPRVLLSDVPWAAYVVLRESIESASVRMTYLEGSLEIMSPSDEHEVTKKQIARFLEPFCLERDIPLYGYGSTTFREEGGKRGLEPDECYCRGADRKIPDLALELVVTRGSTDKLDVHRGLGVREVWIFEGGAFRVAVLRDGKYVAETTSEVFPEVDLAHLSRFIVRKDQHDALREFRDELRATHRAP